MAKTKVDIERLLHWAYCDEIPKKELSADFRPAWDEIEEYGDRGGVSVTWSKRLQRYAHIGTPHPDALLLDYMVSSLPPVRINWDKDAEFLLGHLLPYLGDHKPLVASMATEPVVDVGPARDRRGVSARIVGQKQRAQPVTEESLPGMIVLHAKLKTRPVWDVGPIRLMRMSGANGRPVIEGITKGRRYGAGARGLLRLDPPAAEIACARWEYAIWHSALMTLVDESWKLSEYVALPPAAAVKPWNGEIEKKSRVLHDVTSPSVPKRPLPLRSVRERAGPRRAVSKGSAVRTVPITEI